MARQVWSSQHKRAANFGIQEDSCQFLRIFLHYAQIALQASNIEILFQRRVHAELQDPCSQCIQTFAVQLLQNPTATKGTSLLLLMIIVERCRLIFFMLNQKIQEFGREVMQIYKFFAHLTVVVNLILLSLIVFAA